MAVSTAVLGGETKSRGTFSGRGSRGVLVAWVVLGVTGVALIMLLELWGMLITLLAAVVLWAVTRSDGGEHTVLRNIADRRRWRFIQRNGFEDFTPVGWRPQELATPVRRKVGPLMMKPRLPEGNRKAYNAFRDWPDGVDALHFLQKRGGRTAVAYHLPPNDGQPYFSVVFAVDGPIVGLAGDTLLEQAQEAFGELMAGWGSRQKLVTGIQVVTRILPADTAGHEAWLSDQLDPEAPEDLVTDYSQLLTKLTASSFVQRHYAVIRWDKTTRLEAMAAAHAPGRAGWLRLVGEQAEMARLRLVEARYRNVRGCPGRSSGR